MSKAEAINISGEKCAEGATMLLEAMYQQTGKHGGFYECVTMHVEKELYLKMQDYFKYVCEKAFAPESEG